MKDMDYEQKYKAMLEQARDYHSRCQTEEAKRELEAIFPELREGEEERIKAMIFNCLYQCCDTGFISGTQRDNALSWLEKQKEISMPNSTELIEMWHKEKEMLKEKDFRGDEWRLAYNAFMDGFARGTCAKFEKLKEQKELPLMDGDADLYFDEWNQQNSNPTKRQCFEEGIRYAQRLQKEQKPNIEICPHSIKSKSYSMQKPAERNKEDITFIDEIIGYFDGNELKHTVDEIIVYLSSLRHNIEYHLSNEKQQEWSEEEKRAISVMVEILDTNRVGLSPDDRLKFANMLLSLRPCPHWRPSKEQMDAIRDALNNYYIRHNASASGDPIYESLSSLYNDLKKLK